MSFISKQALAAVADRNALEGEQAERLASLHGLDPDIRERLAGPAEPFTPLKEWQKAVLQLGVSAATASRQLGALFVGGPAHGQLIVTDGGPVHCVISPIEIKTFVSEASPLMAMPAIVTYHRRRYFDGSELRLAYLAEGIAAAEVDRLLLDALGRP